MEATPQLVWSVVIAEGRRPIEVNSLARSSMMIDDRLRISRTEPEHESHVSRQTGIATNQPKSARLLRMLD
jgi:hypothetical protein